MKFVKKAYTEDVKEKLSRTVLLQPNRLSDSPVCDFCADPNPVAVYGANRLTTGEATQCWRWCACADCERIIDGNCWDEFHTKVADRLKRMMPPVVPADIVTQAVWAAIATFFRDASRVNCEGKQSDTATAK